MIGKWKGRTTSGRAASIRVALGAVVVALAALAWSGVAQAEDRQHEWGAFHVLSPAGWEVSEGTYQAGNPSKVYYHRSTSGARVLVAFIDAGEMRETLAEFSLGTLLDVYVSAHFLTRGNPVERSEPWPCVLNVPSDMATHGAYLTLDPAIMGGEGPSEAWACAGRDLSRGLMVIVLGWAEGEVAERAHADGRAFAEMHMMLGRTGFGDVTEAAPEDP